MAKPKPVGCGPTYATNGRPRAKRHPVWVTYAANRNGEHPQHHLRNFTGILQADGYAGFSKLYEGGRVLEAACWAHMRRRFVDLYQLHQSAIAGEALDRIGALYAIEKGIRGRSPYQRRAVRQEHSRPVLEEMSVWLTQTLATLSMKSATAKAISYALTRWDALQRYCDDGRIEIDNNAAERALSCLALGHNNFLFAGSDGGGRSAAAFYSLLGSAKLTQRPQSRDVFARGARAHWRTSDQSHRLLPWNLKPTHDQTLLAVGDAPQLPATT